MSDDDRPWEAVRGQAGQIIYWRRQLPGGAWLAVKWDGQRWHWARRGPDRNPDGVGRIHAEGNAASASAARRAADREAARAKEKA